MEGLRSRGRVHRDGWGVAWYVGDGLVGLVKEPRPAPDSPSRVDGPGRQEQVGGEPRQVGLEGAASVTSTPPSREALRQGLGLRPQWGRVGHRGRPGYELGWCSPAGDTDSEYAFCYLLERLRESRAALGGAERTSLELWRAAEDVGAAGKFNFLLSDGIHLFAYANRAENLHYLLRRPPHAGPVELIDEDYETRLEDIKGPDERAAVVATRPLTDEDWSPAEPHTLYVFRDGDLALTAGEEGVSRPG